MEIIHIVLGKANPDRMNGVNKVVYQLASRQAAAGRKVAIWGITDHPVHDYGKRNFETRLFASSWSAFLIGSALRKAIDEKQGKAVFHLHGGWVPTFWAVAFVMKALGVPYVFTPHGAYNEIAMQRSKLRKRIYFQLFERQVIRGANQVHCIGASEVNGLQRLLPGKAGTLLPYGFEMPVLRPFVSHDSDKFVIGFMGRLDVHTKGLDLLFEAFQRLQASTPMAELWLLGDGAECARLKAMALEFGIQNHVIFWGSKFGDEKWELIRQMHVFTHPSRNEGLPSAVLEAGSMGVPCVVSEATNLGEYVRQYSAGIVVANEDVAALESAFRAMHSTWLQEKLADIGSNARNMVMTAFNWDRLVSKFDQLYWIQS